MTSRPHPVVRTGADRLVADPTLVGGTRWGLVTNDTAVTADLRLTSTALQDAGAPLVALFGPEHGLRGAAQAGASDDLGLDEATGLPVYDTYLAADDALDAMLLASGIDTLLVDLPDIGVRYYTYVWTLVDCLRSAARVGIDVVVLDRPNPLGGLAVEGPDLDPAFASFVGRAPVPQRHGLTAGELALAVRADDAAAGLRTGPVRVVELEGWTRDMLWAATGLPWVMPSPNMPTPETALVYAGTGIVEGTTLSEGRGTTRPFEIVGAPWVDARLAPALTALGLPGVLFRPTTFTPTFHAFAGELVRGVQLHVSDAVAFEPVRTGVLLVETVARLYPEDFGWRLPEPAEPAVQDGSAQDGSAGPGREGPSGTGAAGPSEVLPGRRPFVDLLWGSDALRTTVDAGVPVLTLLAPRSHRPDAVLLY